MPDDKTKKRPLDSSRINIHEPYEVNYWCDVLGCNKAKLEEAVKAVKTSVADVKKYLNK
ncbi:DUF3606 domain-containing protein [Propionispira raffinosivorans]|uniref:DUF3606 domain-containing protein n=1 Tax=Propionispira raffinosivorans TaxID=86959 RepID=UPI00036FE0D7|nr:DUF3606 domain-containing protein [Propionispira raffinosivorans]